MWIPASVTQRVLLDVASGRRPFSASGGSQTEDEGRSPVLRGGCRKKGACVLGRVGATRAEEHSTSLPGRSLSWGLALGGK